MEYGVSMEFGLITMAWTYKLLVLFATAIQMYLRHSTISAFFLSSPNPLTLLIPPKVIKNLIFVCYLFFFSSLSTFLFSQQRRVDPASTADAVSTTNASRSFEVWIFLKRFVSWRWRAFFSRKFFLKVLFSCVSGFFIAYQRLFSPNRDFEWRVFAASPSRVNQSQVNKPVLVTWHF